jgi:hypothetical protein
MSVNTKLMKIRYDEINSSAKPCVAISGFTFIANVYPTIAQTQLNKNKAALNDISALS